MQILGRSSGGLTALATGLSLAIAKYKPSPQVSTNATSSSSGSSYKVHTSSTLDPAVWGVPAPLVLSNSSSSSKGNTFKTTSTVGPGSCPLNTTSYVSTYGALPDPTYAKFNSVKANIMRYREQMSVNLGGWFLQEGWMETSFMDCAIYAGTSEFSIVSGFGTSADGLKSAQNYMEKHWDTWVTEDDFAYLASRGVNTVRIPIGYWSVGSYYCANSSFSPYAAVYENSWKYVGRAINWAAKYDIGVLLDLHGAYGSQNGLDHSGHVGAVDFFTAANEALTTSLLTWLAWELADVTNIIGIELLNEPSQEDGLWTWYNNTATAMRKASSYAKSLPLYIQDAYNLNAGVALVASRNDFTVVDDHSYFVFSSADKALSVNAHIANIEGSYTKTLSAARTKARGNLVIGEWSCSLDSGSLTGVSDVTTATSDFCRAQLAAYTNTTAGMHFWSYTMENCDSNAGWCFESAVGEYLPKYFNVWGLSGLVTNSKLLLNSAAAIKTGNKIKAAIAALKVPGTSDSAASTAPTALVKTMTLSTRDVVSSDEVSSYGMAPLLAAEDDAEDHETVEEMRLSLRDYLDDEDNEDLYVEPVVHRRGLGSVSGHAAHQAQAERRALTAAALARQVGYSDGYLTATYFASAFSTTTPVSKLGFQTQYIVDSWAKRMANSPTKYLAANYGLYSANFKLGQAAAEAAILKIINAA
ncbi:glycoside hydrolase [Microstroma glucosiphilum]|uniref:Glycoside hydrolase n=1 Tax=Pseudomicrostroma glucosiphilum TaxID=1684307 RepID=A0A316U7W5_9BASI|nr:glycoside hydrolase [Pseudomicrostroma glucosiphilum]PWN20541.1 glycoside hydrolase [Pseudomicrostroma glucosiphilum]